MKGKHSQSKFMRFITLPIRALGKAKDLYVRSLTDYATRTSYSDTAGLSAGQFSALPKSLSFSSSRSNNNEDYRELIRAASVRGLGHINEVDMFIQLKHMRESSTTGSKGFQKSCSVGMGFMGRIDEERSTDLEDSVDANKSDHLCPRSRSVVVTNRSTGF